MPKVYILQRKYDDDFGFLPLSIDYELLEVVILFKSYDLSLSDLSYYYDTGLIHFSSILHSTNLIYAEELKQNINLSQELIASSRIRKLTDQNWSNIVDFRFSIKSTSKEINVGMLRLSLPESYTIIVD